MRIEPLYRKVTDEDGSVRFEEVTPEVTDSAYALWLVADRPPFDWFMGLTRDAQDVRSAQGHIHRVEATIDLARAIRDPEQFEAESFADSDPDAEAYLIQQQAERCLTDILDIERAPEPLPDHGEPSPCRSMAEAFKASQTPDTEPEGEPEEPVQPPPSSLDPARRLSG